MNISKAQTGVKGFYRVQVLDKHLNVKKDTGWFPNLITDRGLDYLCCQGNELNNRPSSMLDRCTVGTGSATPDHNDLNLSGSILRSVTNTGASGSGAWVDTVTEKYISRSNPYEFALGAV